VQRLKKAGACLYSIPDKRESFVCDSEKTEFEHFVYDDMTGIESSQRSTIWSGMSKCAKFLIMRTEFRY
jgi:hypothetical protein